MTIYIKLFYLAPRVANFSPAFNEFTSQVIRCSVVQHSSFPLHQTHRSPAAALLYLHRLFSLYALPLRPRPVQSFSTAASRSTKHTDPQLLHFSTFTGCSPCMPYRSGRDLPAGHKGQHVAGRLLHPATACINPHLTPSPRHASRQSPVLTPPRKKQG